MELLILAAVAVGAFFLFGHPSGGTPQAVPPPPPPPPPPAPPVSPAHGGVIIDPNLNPSVFGNLANVIAQGGGLVPAPLGFPSGPPVPPPVPPPAPVPAQTPRQAAAVAMATELGRVGGYRLYDQPVYIAYQSAAGLTADGFPGAHTMNTLNADLANMGLPSPAVPVFPWSGANGLAGYDGVNAPLLAEWQTPSPN